MGPCPKCGGELIQVADGVAVSMCRRKTCDYAVKWKR